ncbi:MAG: hypothetical protein GY896_10790 [Gammaproteobacteria bacterium]|nr:hypothetical protein [Gammaproteobacteria bacterium]MCP4979534.1 hypothetical protein [Gammaproteobacteria bacterium]
MAKFLVIYHGSPSRDREINMDKVMADWADWVSGMGEDLVDPGVGVGMSKTITNDGTVVDNGGSNPVSGYCIITAEDMEGALAKIKIHPYLSMGGSLEIAQTMHS